MLLLYHLLYIHVQLYIVQYNLIRKSHSIHLLVLTYAITIACYHVVTKCCILNIGSYSLVYNFPVSGHIDRCCNYGNSIMHDQLTTQVINHL